MKTNTCVFTSDEMEKLKEISTAVRATVPEDFVRLSGLFLTELKKWNKRMNLISRGDETRAIDKHLLDSLCLLVIEKDLAGKRLLDVGSGAGFPGIVLAAWEPRAQIFLLESRTKKVAFLKAVRRLLGLSNVHVVHSRMEKLKRAGDAFPPVDMIVSRGVKGVSSLVTSLSELLAARGVFVLYKGLGAADELKQCGDELRLRALGFEVALVTPPWQSRTTLIIIRRSAVDRVMV